MTEVYQLVRTCTLGELTRYAAWLCPIPLASHLMHSASREYGSRCVRAATVLLPGAPESGGTDMEVAGQTPQLDGLTGKGLK